LTRWNAFADKPRRGPACSGFSTNAVSKEIGAEKSEIKRLTFTKKSDILFEVMRNQMTITEIRRYAADKRKRQAKRDTFTLNGNTYEVSNDPKHQANQLAGYQGRNPK